MDSDKDKSAESEAPQATQDAPADALSKTPEELEQDAAEQAAANPEANPAQPIEKKVSPIKRFFRKVNLYFLIFCLLVVIAGVVAAVTFFNSQKPPEEADVANQEITEEALRQLANTDASVGNTSQTLTIQGNAIISGQTLMRGNLNVAGNLQTGGSIQGPQLTISGTTNLNDVQANALQVAQNVAIQGDTSVRNLSVAGSATFSGSVTASQITASRIIMSGNAELQIPNHISFPGATPGIATNGGVLGNGGSASTNGSDATGTININTGNNPTAGCFARLTFRQPYSNSPHVTATPIGSAASQTRFYIERDRNGFSVCTSIAPPANQAFAYDYFITN